MSEDKLSIFQRIKKLFLQPNIYPPLEVKNQNSDSEINQTVPVTPTQPSLPQVQTKKGPSIAEMAEQANSKPQTSGK